MSLILGCSEKINRPNFIDFKVGNDSLYVIAKNEFPCPLYIKVTDDNTANITYKQLQKYEDAILLRYPTATIDTTKILEKYKFSGYYGDIMVKTYDSGYNYQLPFLKGYKSSIIQGYDGDFSHKGQFSSKTLDFDMKVGDTVVASRDGIVVKIMIDKYKQGTSKKYKNDGNYVMVYHEDNTFSQYVHLKQYGNFVEVGDTVKVNQPLALSGFTGWTTIPHLHFGVYKPTKTGLISIPIILDSVSAKTLKRGDVITKK